MAWVHEVPTLTLAAIFAAAFIGVTWLSILVISPIFRRALAEQSKTNDLVGFMLASHSAFFGLLLSLLAVATYQNLKHMEQTAYTEAGQLRAIYRSVANYPEPVRSQTLPLIKEYTRFIIEEAWPLQRRGIISEEGVPKMNAIYAQLLGFEPQNKGQEIVHGQTIAQFNEMAETRRMRIQSAETGIPRVMWHVVVVGSLITILLISMFNMSVGIHFILGGALALFLSTVICLIVSLDKPLRGEVSIGPDAYKAVYDRMAGP